MVFFGGAGVSTESGIPDFRGTKGIYTKPAPKQYPYPPEVMISRSFFDKHPDVFFDYYCDEMLRRDALPNDAHLKLAQLEREGKLAAVITQNVDGLHQDAGSINVLELHGGIHRNICMDCRKEYSLDEMLEARKHSPDGVPRCECGGIIKPDMVLYEEPLDGSVMHAAIDALEAADLLLVAGTSLSVYPAAGLIDYFHGNHLVIVNRTPTPFDRRADLCIAASIGDVLSSAVLTNGGTS